MGLFSRDEPKKTNNNVDKCVEEAINTYNHVVKETDISLRTNEAAIAASVAGAVGLANNIATLKFIDCKNITTPVITGNVITGGGKGK